MAKPIPGTPSLAEQAADARFASSFDVNRVRADFPALSQVLSHGVPLVYFDSPATTLKPASVVQAVQDYMSIYPANVHRGLHSLSERATAAYEGARETVARFLGTHDCGEVIFTRGTTDAINLVAQSWGRHALQPGDVILVSELEHHSNLVPWQMLARNHGVVLRFIELTNDAQLDLDSLEDLMSPRVRLVAVTAMSNVTGTIPPLRRIIGLAHAHGARVLIDAAQSLAHHRLDVSRLDADFVAFSGHKMYGPTGIGVLYGKRELLEEMPPVVGGGSMVVRVDRQGAEWNEIPWKFEAGTPPIAEAIGLGAAIDYLGQYPHKDVDAHERGLLRYAHDVLSRIDGLRILGPTSLDHKGTIVGFILENTHPHDLAQLLDRHGIAIRAGHHCAMPLHTRLGIPASARASFSLYNTRSEVEHLAQAIDSVKKLLRRR
jgi:cysteine desulfurase/selenocysteine lyase